MHRGMRRVLGSVNLPAACVVSTLYVVHHGYAAGTDASGGGFCIPPAGTGRPAWGWVYLAMISSTDSMPSFDARTSMRCCFSVPGADGAPCGTDTTRCRGNTLILTGGARDTLVRPPCATIIPPALLGGRVRATAVTTPLCICRMRLACYCDRGRSCAADNTSTQLLQWLDRTT
jgi:hypothetical protein